MAINIGGLTHRLRLERPDATQATGFVEVAEVWGAVAFRSGSGNEALQAGAPFAAGSFHLRIWYRGDLKADWRVTDVENGRQFQISGYGDPDGSRTELHLVCVEAPQ